MRYVVTSGNSRRYQFPTHINDLLLDRSESRSCEVFNVVIRPGKATHVHRHGDTEQVFFVTQGEGTLLIGRDEPDGFPMRPGDVVRVPPNTWHQIRCDGEEDLTYLAVDCFPDGRPEGEPTWDSHVKTICREQGWDYDEVVK